MGRRHLLLQLRGRPRRLSPRSPRTTPAAIVRGTLSALHHLGLIAGSIYLLATLTLIATQRDSHILRAVEVMRGRRHARAHRLLAILRHPAHGSRPPHSWRRRRLSAQERHARALRPPPQPLRQGGSQASCSRAFSFSASRPSTSAPTASTDYSTGSFARYPSRVTMEYFSGLPFSSAIFKGLPFVVHQIHLHLAIASIVLTVRGPVRHHVLVADRIIDLRENIG